MLIFRVFAHEKNFFQKTSLLVVSKFRIFFTVEEFGSNFSVDYLELSQKSSTFAI